jgi:predicted HAD superfamily Cof-like phosphohydrolase
MKKFNIKGAWDEVAKSNLSKIDQTTGKVLRREDGKILKPEGWSPPKLEKFI